MSAPRVVGVLLAGGESRRMGTDKAGLRAADGTTFAAAAHRALAAVATTVVVVGHARGVDVPSARVLTDRPGVRGPLAGIAAALDDAGDGARLVVATCDAPGVTSDDLARLLGADAPATTFADPAGALLVLPCALDVTRARPVVEDAIARGDHSVKGVLRALAARALPVSDDDTARLGGVNTPEELARARR